MSGSIIFTVQYELFLAASSVLPYTRSYLWQCQLLLCNMSYVWPCHLLWDMSCCWQHLLRYGALCAVSGKVIITVQCELRLVA